MSTIDFSQFEDKDRPVVCINTINNQKEMFNCALDAQLCLDDQYTAPYIIEVCNEEAPNKGPFEWVWYDPTTHGPTPLLYDFWQDIDDMGREEPLWQR